MAYVARMGRRAWWECRGAGSSPPKAYYTCLSAQGLLRKKAAGAVATDHHNSPAGFPDDFDDRKLAGKAANCDPVTAGHCNRHKGKLVTNCPNHDHVTVGTL